MAPPAAVGNDPSFSKIHYSHTNNTNNSSKSSEEERESADAGAVDELHAGSMKRPRGRPPGSKNKPKLPTYMSVDPQDALRSHVMELSSGADIAASLSAYARARGRGLAVLHAVGSVNGIAFRQQAGHDPLFLKGNLDLISLSGTLLPDNTMLGPAGLTVFVSGPHGQLMGGPVHGRLVAAGTVLVMAATFSTATYEKLPLHAEPDAPTGLGQPQNLEDPGFNTMENGSSSAPENSSYAWVHQQLVRPPYM